jgi:hypothetical protein
MNFNDIQLIEYLTGQITEELNQFTNEEAKDSYLRKELKSVNQHQLHTRKSYSDRSQSLKSYMVHWIEQEILFLERKRDLTKSIHVPFSEPKEENKIDVNFSVPQLGLFLRILSDTGMINASSKQELMRNVSNSFRTSKVNNISVKSLHNSFYEHDDQTIESVKHVVIEMLNALRSGKY